MKLNKRVSIKVHLLALLLIISSCNLLQIKQYTPEVTLKDYKLESIDFTQATVSFLYELRNKVSVGITFSKFSARLSIDGKQLLNVDVPKGIKLAANGTSEFTVRQTFKFKDIAESIHAVLKKDKLNLKIDGVVGINIPIKGNIDVPFNAQKVINLPKLPTISFGSFTKKSINLNPFNPKATFEVAINVKNPNSFTINLAKLNYSAEIEGSQLASGNAKGQSLPANGSGVIRVPITVKGRQILSLLRTVKSGNFKYRFHGVIILNAMGQNIDIPFDYK